MTRDEARDLIRAGVRTIPDMSSKESRRPVISLLLRQAATIADEVERDAFADMIAEELGIEHEHRAALARDVDTDR